MNIASWLAGIAWPLVSRVMVAMGIGTVTYAGVTVAVNSALSSAKGAFGGMAGEVSSLMAIAGLFESLSIIAGGVLAGVAFMVLKRFSLGSTGA
jgi:Protein of unknown function (DUF2523)